MLRCASCSFQHTAGFRVAFKRARHCARCLSQRGEVRALATRARGAALVVVALCTIQGHRTGERPLSSGARLSCDVLAAASNTQHAFAWRARKRATALAVSREDASTRACDARAVLRRLWSHHVLYKATAPARGLSPSSQGRGATCQLWPPSAESAWTSTLARASGLALSREKRRSTRACIALVVVGSDRLKGRCAGGTLVAFCVRPCRDVPGASSTTKPACASALARALGLALSRGRRRST